MSPLVGFFWFMTAFWAFGATMHLIDAKANCERLQRKVDALSEGRCLFCQEAECDSCGERT